MTVALYGSESRAANANFVAGLGGMLLSMVKSSMAEFKGVFNFIVIVIVDFIVNRSSVGVE